MVLRTFGLIFILLALLLEIIHILSGASFSLSSYEFHHQLGIVFLTGLFLFLCGLNDAIKNLSKIKSGQ